MLMAMNVSEVLAETRKIMEELSLALNPNGPPSSGPTTRHGTNLDTG